MYNIQVYNKGYIQSFSFSTGPVFIAAQPGSYDFTQTQANGVKEWLIDHNNDAEENIHISPKPPHS